MRLRLVLPEQRHSSVEAADGVDPQRTERRGVERHAVVETGRHRDVEVEDGLVCLSVCDGQRAEARLARADQPRAVGAVGFAARVQAGTVFRSTA
ncbi:hypothetical protein ACFRJ7_14310 [Streptomyces sp. NPDC056747]|uniref:hypothetical protein n=1 Tax=Streptomyces sp. NPDC056747 TaxID=3345935 RepID=UPI0036799410